MPVKTIHVSPETHRRLQERGRMGDTMETVILRLLDGAVSPPAAPGPVPPLPGGREPRARGRGRA